MSTLQEAQANNKIAAAAQALNLNANLTANYLQAFGNWLINWNAGHVADKSTAPVPPPAYVVGLFDDPTSGPGSVGPYGDLVIQWASVTIGTAPVCAQPPIPDVPAPQVHAPIEGALTRNVPPGDTTPLGFTVMASDGSQWQKQASPTPFGMAYFYAKVA